MPYPQKNKDQWMWSVYTLLHSRLISVEISRYRMEIYRIILYRCFFKYTPSPFFAIPKWSDFGWIWGTHVLGTPPCGNDVWQFLVPEHVSWRGTVPCPFDGKCASQCADHTTSTDSRPIKTYQNDLGSSKNDPKTMKNLALSIPGAERPGTSRNLVRIC